MPEFFFDGNTKRIYEVPDNSTFIVVSGYRIYTPIGVGAALVLIDIQRDLWSRFQDYTVVNPWVEIAFSRTGGAFRRLDASGGSLFQTNDFILLTSIGWRIVLANYQHEVVLQGNLRSDDGSSLFDNSRLTANGVVPRLEGFDSLQTYTVSSGGGGGGATPSEIWSHANRSLSAAGNSAIAAATQAQLNSVLAAILLKSTQVEQLIAGRYAIANGVLTFYGTDNVTILWQYQLLRNGVLVDTTSVDIDERRVI